MDPDVAAAKRALRAELRVVRRRIGADPDARAEASARIWARVVELLDLGRRPGIERVMMFQSLLGEPETAGWIEWCAERGIDVLLPEVDGPALRVVPGDVDPAALDVVIVPGVAFTADGRRLGQGGGHYDRFLARLRPGCPTVGVGFAAQLVADLPVEPHDVRLTHVVVA